MLTLETPEKLEKHVLVQIRTHTLQFVFTSKATMEIFHNVPL